MAKVKQNPAQQSVPRSSTKPQPPRPSTSSESSARSSSSAHTHHHPPPARSVDDDRSHLLHWYNFLSIFHTFFAMAGMFAASYSYAEYLRTRPQSENDTMKVGEANGSYSSFDVMGPLAGITGELHIEITALEVSLGISILANCVGGLFASLISRRESSRKRTKFWSFVLSLVAFGCMFASMVVLLEVYMHREVGFFSTWVYVCGVIGFIASFVSMRIHLADWTGNEKIISVFMPLPQIVANITRHEEAQQNDAPTSSAAASVAESSRGDPITPTTSDGLVRNEGTSFFRHRRVRLLDRVNNRSDSSDND